VTLAKLLEEKAELEKVENKTLSRTWKAKETKYAPKTQYQ